ncbi:hypothetical protein P7K49_019316, partial [Saguinus oedipus]
MQAKGSTLEALQVLAWPGLCCSHQAVRHSNTLPHRQPCGSIHASSQSPLDDSRKRCCSQRGHGALRYQKTNAPSLSPQGVHVALGSIYSHSMSGLHGR